MQMLKQWNILGAAVNHDSIFTWTAVGEVTKFCVPQPFNNVSQVSLMPTNSSWRNALHSKKIIGLCGGCVHTVLWTKSGEVLSCADPEATVICGQAGQGGRNHPPSIPSPMVQLLKHIVVGAVAGEHHTILWTLEGKALTFGSNAHGQLGHGNADSEFVPRLIEASSVTRKKIVRAAAGVGHSVLLTSEGEIFSFGNGTVGQLGHGSAYLFTDVYEPRLVAFKTSVSTIASGSYHTIMATEQGEVFTFGCGAYGQLGLGTTLNQSQPVHVNKLNNWIVSEVAGGPTCSAVATSWGDVFIFGRLDNKKNIDDIHLPTPVNVKMMRPPVAI